MNVIDLTHAVATGMPIFPGDPETKTQKAAAFEQDGYRTTYICICSHAGTHIDAPFHVLQDGKPLDAFPIDHFVGSGLVIDCTQLPEHEEIPLCAITEYGRLPKEADFLLFFTGHGEKWGSDDYFRAFPTLSDEAVRLIAESGKKGVGFDTPSPDCVEGDDIPIHKAILGDNDAIILENLANLDKLPAGLFTLVALPLSCRDADGAPARVIAITEDETC